MVDTEVFSRRLDALDGYLDRLRSLGEAAEEEYLAEPGIHDLAARYLHLAIEAAIDLANHWIADHGLRTRIRTGTPSRYWRKRARSKRRWPSGCGVGLDFATCSSTSTSTSITVSPTLRSATSSTTSRISGHGRWEDRIAMKMCLGGPPPGAASPRIEPVPGSRGQLPAAAPTGPDVPNSGIRLLKPRLRCNAHVAILRPAWPKLSRATRKTDVPQPRRGASSSIQAFLNFSYVYLAAVGGPRRASFIASTSSDRQLGEQIGKLPKVRISAH